MRFVHLVEYLLMPVGPILGYRLAMHQSRMRNWKVLAWSAGGGVVIVLLFMIFMWVGRMAVFPTTRSELWGALDLVIEFAGFGLLLAFLGLRTRHHNKRRLLVYGAFMAGVVALIPAVIAAVHPPGASLVFGPDTGSAHEIPVYVDRDSSSLKRITTYPIAVIVNAAAIPARAVARDTGLVAWRREIESQTPALVDVIARKFGQRPRTIRFGGRDTIEIVFWNPKVWHDDMESKVLPENSIPRVQEAMKDVASYVWTTLGRGAGITYINVAFVRVVHDSKYLNPKHEVPAQEVSGVFTLKMLETGQLPMVATALREGGAFPPNVQRWLDSLRRPRLTMSEAVERDVGQVPSNVKFTGRDTIDVVFWNPSFWWKDDSLKTVPEETLPVVRQTAKRTAEVLWTRYGRDSAVSVVRVRFTRVLGVQEGSNKRLVDAQDVTAQFTRQQLETGGLDTVQLTTVQR